MSRLWLTGYRIYELGVFGSQDPKLLVIKDTLKKYNQNNHAIRVTEVQGAETDLPIDPYILGYWLGDGTSKSAALHLARRDGRTQ